MVTGRYSVIPPFGWHTSIYKTVHEKFRAGGNVLWPFKLARWYLLNNFKNVFHTNFGGDPTYLNTALKGFAEYHSNLGILTKSEGSESVTSLDSSEMVNSYKIISRYNRNLLKEDFVKSVKEKISSEELAGFKHNMAYQFVKKNLLLTSAYYKGILDYDENGQIGYPVEPQEFLDEEDEEYQDGD